LKTAGIFRHLTPGRWVKAAHNTLIRKTYQRFLANGKHKKVALTACMRKMITILNAMIRDNTMWKEKYA
jgi:transposase